MTPADLRRALERAPRRLPPPPEGGGSAAVAAVFSSDLDLLLVQRSAREGDPWSGHVALPGGRLEPGESPLDAAIRETFEEVGLTIGQEQLLGALDEVVTLGGRPGMLLHPFVFLLPGPLPPATCQTGEIECTLTMPLDALVSGEGRGTMRWKRGNGVELDLPKVDLPGTTTPLWGLTLHVLDDLRGRLR